jgi:hypothetical protein
VRLKFEYEAQPAPHAVLLTKDSGQKDDGGGNGIDVSCREGVVVVRVDNVAERHAGAYQLQLINECGVANLEFRIEVKPTCANRLTLP